MVDSSYWVGPLPNYDISKLSNQRIVCAAQRNTLTDVIVTGARHFDKIMHQQIQSIDPSKTQNWHLSESGFIDQFGNFLTREEAWIVAKRENQILRSVGKDGILYSENLY